jgi:mono/diheme cytochrome c family protein
MTDNRFFSAAVGLVTAGAFVVGAAAVAGAQDSAVKKGEDLFTSQKCTLCHSVAGKGNKKYPLDGVGAKLSAADIKEWLVNPDAMHAKKGDKPLMKMKSFKTLPPEDLDALVAYVGSLK